MNQSKGKASPKTSKLIKNQGDKRRSKPRRPQGSSVSKVQTMPKQVGVAAAYATGQKTVKPRITMTSTDSCRIIHRELVASITGSTAFTVASSIAIQPGLPSSFPWLSTQAVGWEKYRFNRFRVCAYTRTGSNVPGSELIVPDYDAADAAPGSEQIASAYHGVMEDAPWKDICCEFDPLRLKGERFIRTGNLPANLDIKTYDVANLFVCTVDGTAVNWSKLWFEYDVTLINQQLPPGGSLLNGTLFANGTLAAATPYGTTTAGGAQVAGGSIEITASGDILTVSGLTIGNEYNVTTFIAGGTITTFTVALTDGATSVTNYTGGVAAGQAAATVGRTFTATKITVTLTLAVNAVTVSSAGTIITTMPPAPGF